MLAIIRFSLQDMLRHYKPWLAMSALVAATHLIFLGLGGYRNALHQEFDSLPYNDLVVQESNTTGEFFGSHLSPQVGDNLAALGISPVIPEIHDYTGTSISSIIILRGIDLGQYQRVNSFKVLSGKALRPGDPPRTAMIGWRLAERLGLQAGQVISLRGRSFQVMGTFQTGTYVDNEAWIALAEAQALLGYGSDVSIYIIPADGTLKAGDILPGNISIVARGQGPKITSDQFKPLFNVMEQIYNALGVASLLTLATVLFRMAWIHRRELAILRSVGFQSPRPGPVPVQPGPRVDLGGSDPGDARRGRHVFTPERLPGWDDPTSQPQPANLSQRSRHCYLHRLMRVPVPCLVVQPVHPGPPAPFRLILTTFPEAKMKKTMLFPLAVLLSLTLACSLSGTPTAVGPGATQGNGSNPGGGIQPACKPAPHRYAYPHADAHPFQGSRFSGRAGQP